MNEPDNSTDSAPFDKEQERIQRALNQAKKLALEEKYGAHFGGDSKLSPQLESQWLNYIEEFESQFEHAQRIIVRDFVGNPIFKPLGEIPPDQLEIELNSVLEFLSLHEISADSVAEVSDQEFYRFITTELMNQEIDDIHIDGMMHCFTYEDFHPNDDYDARMFAEHFLWDLFERHFDYALQNFSADELYSSAGQSMNREEMARSLRRFYDSYVVFTEFKHDILECRVDGDYADLLLQSRWSGLRVGSMEQLTNSGVTVLRMKRSPYGGFVVIQANIIGWNF
jgi:hypothetical protein